MKETSVSAPDFKPAHENLLCNSVERRPYADPIERESALNGNGQAKSIKRSGTLGEKIGAVLFASLEDGLDYLG